MVYVNILNASLYSKLTVNMRQADPLIRLIWCTFNIGFTAL